MRGKRFVTAIDIGGTKLAVGIGDSEGRLVAKFFHPTEAERGPDAVINSIVKMTEAVAEMAKIPLKHTSRIGVACVGPLDPVNGIIFSPPNLPGWDEIPLKQILTDRLGLPVVIDNDANVAALGEATFGAGIGAKSLAYFTLSTGIGGGIILDGKIYQGFSGAAAEFGHQVVWPNGPVCGCGENGHLEAISSGTGIARRAAKALVELIGQAKEDSVTLRTDEGGTLFSLAGRDVEKITAKMVFEAANLDDKFAQSFIEEAAFYLGLGTANVVNILNPEVVIFGGGLSKSWPQIEPRVREAVDRHVLAPSARKVKLLPAILGEDIGIMGAVALALGD